MEQTNKEKWVIDPGHSEISFKIKQLMITNVKGRFNESDAIILSTGYDFFTVEID